MCPSLSLSGMAGARQKQVLSSVTRQLPPSFPGEEGEECHLVSGENISGDPAAEEVRLPLDRPRAGSPFPFSLQPLGKPLSLSELWFSSRI